MILTETEVAAQPKSPTYNKYSLCSLCTRGFEFLAQDPYFCVE
ncbi:hypothetical protein C7445_1249 [Alicyclobacillus sacchari]|uniref:Uncharacterized protein n=1 Tax=Alicyclobacillus sacchari TaxID=392010 RepID=A0A4R8LD92_9BACL|nr:hypothetical protein C7445_1249 [Alicyclobacillus sacchari]